MLIHSTCALSDHLCQATEYEWHRLSQIWGLCWQTPPSSSPLGNTPDYCQCVRACVKRCHYVCLCEGWCSCRRTWKPLCTRRGEWCPMGNRARAPSQLFMQSELARDVTHPLVAMLDALSSWATVAVNSCCVSKHTALWSQQSWRDVVNSCAVFDSKLIISPWVHWINRIDYSCRYANQHQHSIAVIISKMIISYFVFNWYRNEF